MHEWAVEFIERSKPSEMHSFAAMYLISTIHNILLCDGNGSNIARSLTKQSKVVSKLIALFQRDLPGQGYKIILDMIKGMKAGSTFWKDMEVNANIHSKLQEMLEDFETMFAGINLHNDRP